MSVVVLDTTVASFWYAKRRELELYESALVGHTPALPFQVIAEMRLGARLRGWGEQRRDALEAFLASCPTVETSDEVVRAWVTVMARSQEVGRLLGDGDGWIAACALANSAALLTHDADFRGLEVEGLEVVCHAP